jgi:hypothetical protein
MPFCCLTPTGDLAKAGRRGLGASHAVSGTAEPRSHSAAVRALLRPAPIEATQSVVRVVSRGAEGHRVTTVLRGARVPAQIRPGRRAGHVRRFGRVAANQQPPESRSISLDAHQRLSTPAATCGANSCALPCGAIGCRWLASNSVTVGGGPSASFRIPKMSYAGPALYPTPRTVSTTSGCSRSRSTFDRSRWTCTFTSRVSAP